jgi:hypothetical protein
MIELIITANDKLYAALSERARANGHVPKRARDVLQGSRQAARLGKARLNQASLDEPSQDKVIGIVVDMSLHAADTLIETLHSRQDTSGIPLVAVKCDGQTMPLALRRLCTDILEMDGSAPFGEQTMGRL